MVIRCLLILILCLGSLLPSFSKKDDKDALLLQYYLWGLHSLEQGKVDEAIGQIEQAIKHYPRDPHMRIALCRALSIKGKIDEATEHCKYAAQVQPNTPVILVSVAQHLYSIGDYEQSLEYYKHAASLDSLIHDALLSQIGDIYIAINNPEHAHVYYRKAVQAYPGDMQVLFKLAKIESILVPEDDTFRGHLQQLLQAEHQKEWTLKQLATFYHAQADYSNAWKYVHILLKQYPNELYSYLLLSDMFFRDKQHDKAVEVLLKKLDMFSNSEDFHHELAKHYAVLGEVAKSIEHYRQTLALTQTNDPKQLYIYKIGLLDQLLKSQQYIEAKNIILPLLKQNPSDKYLNYQIANLYSLRERYDLSLKIYEKLLKEHPEYHNDQDFLYNYATALENQNQFERAVIIWNDYLGLAHDDVDTWMHFAGLKYKLGLADEAIDDYLFAQSLQPDNKSLHINILKKVAGIYIETQQLYLAKDLYVQMYTLSGNAQYLLDIVNKVNETFGYDEAYGLIVDLEQQGHNVTALYLKKAELIKGKGDSWSAAMQYQKALVKDGKNVNALVGLADIYLGIGQYDEAKDLYKRAIQVNKRHLHSHYNLGLCYTYLNDLEAALDSYLQVVSIDPDYVDTYYSLGAVYLEMGKTSDAENSWRRYLQLLGGDVKSSYASEIYSEFPDLKQELVQSASSAKVTAQ